MKKKKFASWMERQRPYVGRQMAVQLLIAAARLAYQRHDDALACGAERAPRLELEVHLTYRR